MVDEPSLFFPTPDGNPPPRVLVHRRSLVPAAAARDGDAGRVAGPAVVRRGPVAAHDEQPLPHARRPGPPCSRCAANTYGFPCLGPPCSRCAANTYGFPCPGPPCSRYARRLLCQGPARPHAGPLTPRMVRASIRDGAAALLSRPHFDHGRYASSFKDGHRVLGDHGRYASRDVSWGGTLRHVLVCVCVVY